jgi:hypothetical protein
MRARGMAIAALLVAGCREGTGVLVTVEATAPLAAPKLHIEAQDEQMHTLASGDGKAQLAAGNAAN